MNRRRNRALWLGLLLLGVVVAGVGYERLWGGGGDVRIAVRERLEPPSAAHPFGTDDLGRDVLARVLGGGGIALEVGLVAVGIGLAAGTTLALAAVRWGRWPTRAMGAVMDGLMAFPSILLALAIIAALGTGYVPAMIAIGIGLVPVFWRQTRAQAIAIEGREFVLAARGLGATEGRILWRHIAPQITPLLVIQATATFSGAVLAEASLSFLGVGTQPPTPSWGRMLLDATRALGVAPWTAIFPGAALAVTVLGINLCGDGLRDALDPQLRRIAGREPLA